MNSSTAPTITPKQKQVLDLLERDLAPAEIAKRLKISPSGVYGHMRNMRRAGISLPGVYGELADPPLSAGAEPPPPPAPQGNGAGDPISTLRQAIARDEARLQAIEQEVSSLKGTIDGLSEERDQLDRALARYTAALSALEA